MQHKYARLQSVHKAVNYLQSIHKAVNYLQSVHKAENYLQSVHKAVNYLQSVHKAVSYLQNVHKANYYKLRELGPGHELPINNLHRHHKGGKIHFRMHAGNLSNGILEPSPIRIGNVIGKLRFGLFEELNLLSKFTHHAAKLNLLLGGPLLKFGHLGLCLLYLLLQVNYFVAER